VDACPVNSIMERDRWQHGREWDLAKHDTVCTACGSGCSVTTSSKDGKIVKVNAKEENGYICAIGRFGFDSMTAANRITSPLKRQGGKLVPTTWEDAAAIAAEALKKAGANAGFIAAGSLTNEEAFAVQKLARDVAGSANIDTPASVYAGGLISALRSVFGEAGPGIASQADLKTADCVVVVGADPSQKQQSMQEADVMIRRRAQAGAKVIVVSTVKTDLAGHQNAMHLQLKAGTDPVLFAGIMSAVLAEGTVSTAKGLDGLKKSLVSVDDAAAGSGVPSEQITAAAKTFAAAKQPVVVIGTGISASEESSLQVLNLAMLKNAGLIPLMPEANALGVLRMGCVPDRGPGAAKVKKAGKGYREMKSGMETLYVAGNVADADFTADVLIVQASHMTTLAQKADLVLPMAFLYEMQGTVVNTYGMTKNAVQVQQPDGEAKEGVEIVAAISQAVSKAKAFNAKDVAAALKKAKTGKLTKGSFQPVTAAAVNPSRISTAALVASMNKGLLSGSSIAKVMVITEGALQG
jgi:predicted molibdopterin-dependent oxidoreductase YjgC